MPKNDTPEVVKAAFKIWQDVSGATLGMSRTQHNAWMDKNDPLPRLNALSDRAAAEGLELGDCTKAGQKWRARGAARWRRYLPPLCAKCGGLGRFRDAPCEQCHDSGRV